MIEGPALLMIAFALGACVGSFLNVVIYRVPRGMSVGRPRRSFCPMCKREIPAWRNIPLFSWLLLRGKCGDCAAPIPFRYFAVELVTAVLFLFLAAGEDSRAGAPELPRLLLDFTAISLCVAITVIDFQLAIIPDPLTIPWLPLCVIACAFEPELLRGRWLDAATPGSTPVTLALALAGIALGAFPALFVDFIRRDRETECVNGAGEPESALPTADEEFSLAAETREFFLPLLLPAALCATALVLAMRGFDFPAHPGVAAAVASAAGIGAGLLLIYGIRFVFSAVFRREAMGLGDAKFLALAGALLGAEGTVLVFGAACFLGAIPAFGALLRKLPVPTVMLIVATAIPVLFLDDLARSWSPAVALLVGMGIPCIALFVFFRKLRNSDIELNAMPFGPFLALATVVLLLAFPQIAGFLHARLFASSEAG